MYLIFYIKLYCKIKASPGHDVMQCTNKNTLCACEC